MSTSTLLSRPRSCRSARRPSIACWSPRGRTSMGSASGARAWGRGGGKPSPVRTRKARLAALCAFLQLAGHRDVDALHVVEQALGEPMKRFEREMLGSPLREKMLAVIGNPRITWTSQRDHLLLHILYNTGARVSEIIGVRLADVVLEGAACVHLHGKGRKQRTMPLWRSTAKAVRVWSRLNRELASTSAPMPNRNGHPMARTNVTQQLALAVAAATSAMPTMRAAVSRHTRPATPQAFI